MATVELIPVCQNLALTPFLPRLLSSPELPKTATGKDQKYVFRGKPAISKQ